jgi:hypothetical protein
MRRRNYKRISYGARSNFNDLFFITKYAAGITNIKNNGALTMPPTIGAAVRCIDNGYSASARRSTATDNIATGNRSTTRISG